MVVFVVKKSLKSPIQEYVIILVVALGVVAVVEVVMIVVVV